MGSEAVLWGERALLAGAVVLVTAGALSAWVLSNAAKRLGGLIIAWLGVVMGLTVLGAPDGALIAGVAVAFAHTTVGAALLVRLQESYGATESRDIDVADAQSEPAEPPP